MRCVLREAIENEVEKWSSDTRASYPAEEVAQAFIRIMEAGTEPQCSAVSAEAPDDDDNTMRDDPMFNRGVDHVVDLLAKTLAPLGHWHAGDGSEDYDCDLEETLRNILAAKGLYDPESGEFASAARDEPQAAQHVFKPSIRTALCAECSGTVSAPWHCQAGSAPTASEPDEDFPDCSTTRERDLYFALMLLCSAVAVRRREWRNWRQAGTIVGPVVLKSLRIETEPT